LFDDFPFKINMPNSIGTKCVKIDVLAGAGCIFAVTAAVKSGIIGLTSSYEY